RNRDVETGLGYRLRLEERGFARLALPAASAPAAASAAAAAPLVVGLRLGVFERLSCRFARRWFRLRFFPFLPCGPDLVPLRPLAASSPPPPAPATPGRFAAAALGTRFCFLDVVFDGELGLDLLFLFGRRCRGRLRRDRSRRLDAVHLLAALDHERLLSADAGVRAHRD